MNLSLTELLRGFRANTKIMYAPENENRKGNKWKNMKYFMKTVHKYLLKT